MTGSRQLIYLSLCGAMAVLAGCERAKPVEATDEDSKAGGKKNAAATFTPVPGVEAIDRKLDTIRIPEVDFHRAGVEDVFAWLGEQSRLHDHEDGTGVVFQLDGSVRTWLDVTIRFEDVPLREVLEYISAKFELAYSVTDEYVLIVSNSTLDDDTLYSRLFEMTGAFVSLVNGNELDIQANLEAQGIEFSEEAKAYAHPVTGELMMKNVRPQMMLVELLFEQLGEETADERENRLAEIDRIERKLKNIVIPSVDFDGTRLGDAIDALKRFSIEYDTSTDDPAGKGVNIRIVEPQYEVRGGPGFGFEAGGGNLADSKITLRLVNVPLADALRYTSSLAQAGYRVDPIGVVVRVIGGYEDEMVTRAYGLRPDIMEIVESEVEKSGTPVADPFGFEVPKARGSPMHQFLQTLGYGQYDSRKYLHYDAKSSSLFVRDFDNNLERLDEIVAALNSAGPDAWVEEELTRVEEKVARLSLPEVSFDEVPLERVLAYLEQRSRELDVSSGVATKGVRIRLNPGGVDPEAHPEIYGEYDPLQPTPEYEKAEREFRDFQKSVRRYPVTLRLRGVSLSEAIAAAAEQAGLKAYVEAGQVVVSGE